MMLLLSVALLGCGRTVDCRSPSNVIAEVENQSLTCHEAGWWIAHTEVLAGRVMPVGDRRLAIRTVADAFEADPSGTLDWLEEARVQGVQLGAAQGPVAAERRARAVFHAHQGGSPLPGALSELAGVRSRTLSVWSVSEDTELALTEADIESWIRYASLCREIQSGGPLRVSVSDRVAVYKTVRERFETGTRAEKVALSNLGAVWLTAADNWRAAPYETQQAFISQAPLPPPMTASSLGYLQAVVDGDVVRHVAALSDALGPFTVSRRGPMFMEEVPAP